MAESHYYTSHEYFQHRFDEIARQMKYPGTDPQSWQRTSRAKLVELLGLATMKPCYPNLTYLEQETRHDLVLQKYLLSTEPSVQMPFYKILPPGYKENGNRYPVVICPHGHGSGGKLSTTGDTRSFIKKAVEQYNYAYAIQLAKAGFITFAPDARGFGERRERLVQGDQEEQVLSSSCTYLNRIAIPLGQTVAGMWTWDLMRLLDFIQTEKDCDSQRIGCAGLSGGGLQTLYFAALDKRVQCALISGYFYGVRDSLLDMNENCSCNYIPHLWEYFDMGDIGGLIAPRPVMIETGTEDTLNGIRGVENVTEQIQIMQQVYEAMDSSKQVSHVIFEGDHRWYGEQAATWLHRCLD
jgi:dienelactone hydrolase